jgi:hypothetical protein
MGSAEPIRTLPTGRPIDTQLVAACEVRLQHALFVQRLKHMGGERRTISIAAHAFIRVDFFFPPSDVQKAFYPVGERQIATCDSLQSLSQPPA